MSEKDIVQELNAFGIIDIRVNQDIGCYYNCREIVAFGVEIERLELTIGSGLQLLHSQPLRFEQLQRKLVALHGVPSKLLECWYKVV